MTAVEQQLMQKAADIRGRKARIEKLQAQLQAALAEIPPPSPAPNAAAKSSIWSASVSDDEARSSPRPLGF